MIVSEPNALLSRKSISENTETEDDLSISQTQPLPRMSNKPPQAPEYEDIQELQATRSANPSSSSSGGPNTAAEYVFTQCPAYAAPGGNSVS
jgi:hypothetical protein